jgi:hypothetical protein
MLSESEPGCPTSPGRDRSVALSRPENTRRPSAQGRMGSVTPFLAFGLEVSFIDDDDSHLYSTSQRERKDLSWRRRDEINLPGETAPIVGMDCPPRGFNTQGFRNRTFIHPVPKTSALWGSVTVGDEVVLYRSSDRQEPSKEPAPPVSIKPGSNLAITHRPIPPEEGCPRSPVRGAMTRRLRNWATGDNESLRGGFTFQFRCPENRRVDLET